MFSFLKKIKQETGNAIAFDLSVDSLRVAVFERGEGGVRLIKKILKDLPDRDHADGVAALLVKEIREFIFHAVKESHRVPSCVKIGFPSDLVINSIETFSVERPAEKNGKRISEGEMTHMFRDAIAGSRSRDGEHAIVRHTPLSVEVDGYEIDLHKEWPSPVGERVVIRVFLAKMPKVTWRFFSDLPKMWGGIDFQFFSLQELQPLILSALCAARDAIFVDVSALTTEISFVKDGNIAYVAAFPFGGRTITQRISQELKLSFADAERLKSQLGTMLLPEDLERKAQGIITKSLLEWRRSWEEQIALDPKIIFPDKLYLSGGGSLSSGIASVFEDATIKEDLFVSGSPIVTTLDAARLAEGRISGEKLSGPGDVSLTVLMLSDEKNLNSPLKRQAGKS